MVFARIYWRKPPPQLSCRRIETKMTSTTEAFTKSISAPFEATPPVPAKQEEKEDAFVARRDQMSLLVAIVALTQTFVAIFLVVLQIRTNFTSPLLVLAVNAAPYIAFLLSPIALFTAAPFQNNRQRISGAIGIAALITAWTMPMLCAFFDKITRLIG